MKRNDAFDLLKLFFTVIIVAHHTDLLWGALNRGYIAVEFFFITSGYFLYQTRVDHPKMGSVSYFKRRFWKLYPPYLTAYIVVLLVALLTHWEIRYGTWYAPITELLWMQNWGIPGSGAINYPLWYLSVLFPAGLIIFFLSRSLPRWIYNVLAAALIAATYVTMLLRSPYMEQWDFAFGVFYVPFWRGAADMLVGTLLFQLSERVTINQQRVTWFIEAVCSVLILLFLRIEGPFDFVVLLLFILLVYAISQPNGCYRRIGDNRVVRWLSQYQYGAYLNHAAVIIFFRQTGCLSGLSSYLQVFIILCLVWIAAFGMTKIQTIVGKLPRSI